MIKDFAHNNYQQKRHLQLKRRIKKDYQKREFNNPYFNRPEEKKVNGFNTKLYLKIIAVVFLLYVLVFSNLFGIEFLQISGIDMINEAELKQEVENQLGTWRFFLLPQRNLILLSKKKLADKISAKYKLDKLEIDKGWKKLQINIAEKINYLIVYNKEKFFFAGEEGIVTQEISQEKAVSYWDRFPILNTAENITVGDQIISPKAVKYILEFNEKIKQTGIDFNGYENNGEGEITLVSKAGWRAHFDINSDINLSIENMKLILDEKVEDQSKLEYIDLRFGNKVFYK